jgi:hypothetical protein
MVDSNLALVTYLKQSAALVELVTNQDQTKIPEQVLIYCGTLPEGYKPEINGCAITFINRGGAADTEAPIIRPSVQIECWAPALGNQQARKVYRAVFDQLHQKNNIDLGDIGYILSITEEVQGQDVTDPDTKWVSVLSYYRLILRN